MVVVVVAEVEAEVGEGIIDSSTISTVLDFCSTAVNVCSTALYRGLASFHDTHLHAMAVDLCCTVRHLKIRIFPYWSWPKFFKFFC